MASFKVVIAGGRTFNNYSMLSKSMCKLLKNVEGDVEIISGNANGADKLGELFAKNHELPCTVVKARWKELGRRAGYARNVEMANMADAVVVFWDGESKGSGYMIDIAKEKGLPVRVVHYKNG